MKNILKQPRDIPHNVHNISSIDKVPFYHPLSVDKI